MLEVANFVVWGVFVVALIVNHIWSARQWDKERSGLLDRIMSRDYEQYADMNIKVGTSKAPTQVVAVDELVRKLEEREQGVSVI